jgi:hypothetical protein
MKTFTLAEANQLLPRLKQMLDELIAVRDQLAREGVHLHSLLQRASGNGGNQHSNAYYLLLERFNARLSELEALGCELKDLDQGLVDFPSYRDGKLVYLCWQRGEDRIRYWHPLDAGFAGRQPL